MPLSNPTLMAHAQSRICGELAGLATPYEATLTERNRLAELLEEEALYDDSDADLDQLSENAAEVLQAVEYQRLILKYRSIWIAQGEKAVEQERERLRKEHDLDMENMRKE